MENKLHPKVTFVGGGPGDPKLITIRGREALEQADIVLYDALISLELLKYAAGAELIFVGKRKGLHSYSQNEINLLIVEKAFQNGHVVRLKGGDPFIFGRGAEEVEYVQAFGIDTEIIPGISSSTSVPARAGISLTQRGVSESFWVITGTTTNGTISSDLKLAAKSTATVVILMGMSNLKQIVSVYQKSGKGSLPVAIIQNGFMKNEKIVYGRVDTIEEAVCNHRISNPAIIIIGEVVSRNFRNNEIVFDELHALTTHFKVNSGTKLKE